MKKDKTKSSQSDTLRQSAEKKPEPQNTGDIKIMSEVDYRAMVHELQVRQIELELQNDELRRAQRELEESRDKYADLYDFAPVGYLTFDELGMVHEANLTAAKFMGVTRSVLLDKFFKHFLTEESKTKFSAFCKSVLRSTEQQSCEVELVIPRHPSAWIEIKGITESKTTDLKRIRAAIVDITQRRRGQEAVRRLAAIVESSEDAIVGISFFGIIESWNYGAERLYGYAAGEVIGRPITLLLPPGHEDEVQDFLRRIMEGEHVDHRDTVRMRKDGRFVDVAISMTPIFDADGNICGAANISHDLSAQKHTEEIMRAMSRLEAATLLAGGIAHDFNNLMAIVLGNAGLLAMEFKNRHDVRETLDAIIQSAETAGKLALQMLAFARGGRLQSQVLNLNDTVKHALELQKSALLRGITVKFTPSSDLLNVEADPMQMSQILLNLITNAIEAIDGHGEIAISTHNMDISEEFALRHAGLKPGPHVCLLVKDNGRGMSANDCQHVFDPFYSTKAQGRGLGLAAVYGIVKNHGGHIAVESLEGDGSCFTVWLPSTQREQKVVHHSEVSVAGGHETILAVDDEEHILKIMVRSLESSGYNVLTAINGKEAIRIATEYDGEISLVILDMGMPVMDGAEAYGLLKSLRPNARVLICSGYDKYDSARALLEGGAEAFLQKPFRVERLIQDVRQVLDSQ